MNDEFNKILLNELKQNILFWENKIESNKSDVKIVEFCKKMIDLYLDKFNNIKTIYNNGFNSNNK